MREWRTVMWAPWLRARWLYYKDNWRQLRVVKCSADRRLEGKALERRLVCGTQRIVGLPGEKNGTTGSRRVDDDRNPVRHGVRGLDGPCLPDETHPLDHSVRGRRGH